MDNRTASLILSYEPKIGPRTLAKLKAIKPLGQLVALSKSDLLSLGIPEAVATLIVGVRAARKVSDIERELSRFGIKYTIIGDKDYPLLLSDIPDAPNVLFYRGSLASLKSATVSVVGSRKASSYGLRATQVLTEGLVGAGVTIVSGLALGIDGAAHKTALATHGQTVAVLANGLDTVYPASHSHLASQIIDSGGALVSEYPPGTPSYRSNFPVRNRIIAGLAIATLIVEAGKKSGSLLTAKACLEYNRDVLAVPHNLFTEGGEGPNQLIALGATLVTGLEDILHIIGVKSEKAGATQLVADTKSERIILDTLGSEQMYVDDIADQTGLSLAELNAALSLMEMKRLVRHVGGNRYIKGY